MSRYDAELRVAIEAVRQASRLTRAVRAAYTDDQRATKADDSPVTVADLGAQALVSLALGKAFPDDTIVGEEDTTQLRAADGGRLARAVAAHVAAVRPDIDPRSMLAAIDRCRSAGSADGRYWALDPVDGTKGFLRGEQYAVALALVEEGEVVVAALACPVLPSVRTGGEGRTGAVFVAERGEGASELALDDEAERPVRVDDVDDAAAARFCESVEAAHSHQGDASRVAALLGITAPPLRMDSQCKYGAVARGDASIYLRLPRRAEYRERIWDHAAGSLLVGEAGGEVTDARGQPLDFRCGRTLERNEGIVATNGRLHREVLAAVRRVLGG